MVQMDRLGSMIDVALCNRGAAVRFGTSAPRRPVAGLSSQTKKGWGL
jgi:hypothetical protein